MTSTPELSRPDGGSENGVSFRTMANKNASMRPSTKTGIDTPRLAKTIDPTSTGELRRYAENMPSGTPTTMANSIAKSVSSIVVGRRSTSKTATGRECLIEVPEVAPRELAEIRRELVVDERRGHLGRAELPGTAGLEQTGRDGLVETVAADEVVAHRVGRALTEDGAARIAGNDPRQDEHDEHDPEQDRDRHEQPPDDEASHGLGSSSRCRRRVGMRRQDTANGGAAMAPPFGCATESRTG